MKSHVISCLVLNQPGVLAHVAGMFSARGYNIDSLVVGRTEDPALSRMVIVTRGDEATVEAIRKQLGKIVTVVKVKDVSAQACVKRDLVLIQVACLPERRAEIKALSETFRASICDVGPRTITVQLVGQEEKIEAFIELIRPYGIKQLNRTGLIAMPRAVQATAELDEEELLALSGRSTKKRAQSDIPPGIDVSLIPPG